MKRHVLGTASKNSPYISTADASQSLALKDYGPNRIEINARDLQRDINAGLTSQDIVIVPYPKLKESLERQVAVAQTKYDVNPSERAAKNLAEAQRALGYVNRDAECLISPCIPAPYITWPNGRATKPATAPTAPVTSPAPPADKSPVVFPMLAPNVD